MACATGMMNGSEKPAAKPHMACIDSELSMHLEPISHRVAHNTMKSCSKNDYIEPMCALKVAHDACPTQ